VHIIKEQDRLKRQQDELLAANSRAYQEEEKAKASKQRKKL